MRLRHALLPFLAAFTLLLAQQGAYWHALAHLTVPTAGQEDGPPDSKSCPLDDVYARVGSGMAAAALAVAAPCGADATISLTESFTFTPAPTPSARAPPAFL